MGKAKRLRAQRRDKTKGLSIPDQVFHLQTAVQRFSGAPPVRDITKPELIAIQAYIDGEQAFTFMTLVPAFVEIDDWASQAIRGETFHLMIKQRRPEWNGVMVCV
jgi:hypothetical protein